MSGVLNLSEVVNQGFSVLRGPYDVPATDQLGVCTRNMHAGNTAIRETLEFQDSDGKPVKVSALKGGFMNVSWAVVTDDREGKTSGLCVVGLSPADPEVL